MTESSEPMSPSQPVARGHYCKTWTGKAKLNLVRQLPLIAQTYPDVTRFYPATVNVLFGPMIVVAGADVRTPPLAWKERGEDGEAGEVFDLVRCRLTFERLGVTADALMYVGHWSLHRLDLHKQEFLVDRYIDGLEDGDAIAMTCRRQIIDLPYSKSTSDAGDARQARTLVIL